MDHIVSNLWRITCPGSKIYIPPFPLEWIFTPFSRDYYSYAGSLSQPPCSEIVTWIICHKPIAISQPQVKMILIQARTCKYILSTLLPYNFFRVIDRTISKNLCSWWPVTFELSTSSTAEQPWCLFPWGKYSIWINNFYLSYENICISRKINPCLKIFLSNLYDNENKYLYNIPI